MSRTNPDHVYNRSRGRHYHKTFCRANFSWKTFMAGEYKTKPRPMIWNYYAR